MTAEDRSERSHTRGLGPAGSGKMGAALPSSPPSHPLHCRACLKRGHHALSVPCTTRCRGLWRKDREVVPPLTLGGVSCRWRPAQPVPQMFSTPLVATEVQTDGRQVRGYHPGTGRVTLDRGRGGNASFRCQSFCVQGYSNCTLPISVPFFFKLLVKT